MLLAAEKAHSLANEKDSETQTLKNEISALNTKVRCLETELILAQNRANDFEKRQVICVKR